MADEGLLFVNTRTQSPVYDGDQRMGWLRSAPGNLRALVLLHRD